MEPNFSIIIPAYNVEKTLPRSVEELEKQLGEHDEIVIVEDASPDSTLAVAQALAKNNEKIRVVSHTVNKGCFQARKTGIGEATANYILFLDADDEFESDTLSTLRSELSKKEADILHFGLQFIDHSFSEEGVRRKEKEDYFAPFKGSLNRDDLFNACFNESKYEWNLVNKCFKTSICKKAISFLPEARVQRGEDALLYFAISFFSKTYRGLADKSLYIYNFGNGQDNFHQVTLAEYEEFLESKAAFDGIQSFLSVVAHEPFHEKAAREVGLKLVSNCVWRAKSFLKPSDRAAGYKAAISKWGPYACAALRQEFKNNELSLFKEPLFDKQSQKRENKKYIATYYHQISGGGVEGVLHSAIKIWKSLGYKVFLFLNEETEGAALKALGVDSYCILPKLDGSAESVLKREEAIAQVLDFHDIDLVVYHAWVNKALPWDMVTFKTNGVSFVVHCHGIFSHYALAADPYFASMPYIYSQADAIVSLSETDASFWRMFNKNVFVTVNPPTYSCNNVEPIDPCANGKNILWLARVAPEKKPESIIEAFNLIAPNIPDAKLTLVGSASSRGYEKKIDELIEDSPVNDRIERISWTNSQDAYYRSARLFVMTGNAKEGYPLTLAESKTFGLPCVMYDLPYLTLVEDGRGILTAPPDDICQLASLMEKVLTDDALCGKLGKEARESIEDLANFDFTGLWSAVFACARENTTNNTSSPSLLWETFLGAYSAGYGPRFAETNWLRNENKRLNAKVKKYKNANSWKIGRGITWLPRKAKRTIKSLRK